MIDQINRPFAAGQGSIGRVLLPVGRDLLTPVAFRSAILFIAASAVFQVGVFSSVNQNTALAIDPADWASSGPVQQGATGDEGRTPDVSLATLLQSEAAAVPAAKKERARWVAAGSTQPSSTIASDSVRLAAAEDDSPSRPNPRMAALQRPLSEIRVVVQANGPTPENVAKEVMETLPELTLSQSGQAPFLAERYPIDFCHRPLYFEELNLERCGNSYGCATNAISAGYFLANTALVPYRLVTQRPDVTVSTRGDCRTCQQYPHDIEPLNRKPRGALAEAAAAAGFVFLML